MGFELIPVYRATQAEIESVLIIWYSDREGNAEIDINDGKVQAEVR